MFLLATLLGFYSYSIFFLGIFHLLYKPFLLIDSLFFAAVIIASFKYQGYWQFHIQYKKILSKTSWITKVCIVLLFVQLNINLIGVLGPEIGFDALWYHLTLPKIYLVDHSIHHIAGSLFYYSDMPKLGEMFYVAALAFGNEIAAKSVHFFFSFIMLISLYKLSRKFVSQELAFLAVVLFYSNLVVGWESISAYIDLIRTFFELMAFWGIVNYFETKRNKWVIVSAIMLGFAVSSKLLSVGTIPICMVLLLYIHKFRFKRQVLWYLLISVLVVSPWLIFSYVNTGNPVYPFFTPLYKVDLESISFSPISIMKEFWMLFTHAPDPVAPIYLIIAPLLYIAWKKLDRKEMLLAIYSILALGVWYVTPHPGAGRFILPYLPVLSILVVVIIGKIEKSTIHAVSIYLIIFCSVVSIVYRALANYKYIPHLLGKESKAEFLMRYLNFSFGDYYDIDRYMKKHMSAKDTVLLIGLHNLYYVKFPFIEASQYEESNFNYILTQNTQLPEKYIHWKLKYKNDITHVALYSK